MIIGVFGKLEKQYLNYIESLILCRFISFFIDLDPSIEYGLFSMYNNFIARIDHEHFTI